MTWLVWAGWVLLSSAQGEETCSEHVIPRAIFDSDIAEPSRSERLDEKKRGVTFGYETSFGTCLMGSRRSLPSKITTADSLFMRNFKSVPCASVNMMCVVLLNYQSGIDVLWSRTHWTNLNSYIFIKSPADFTSHTSTHHLAYISTAAVHSFPMLCIT